MFDIFVCIRNIGPWFKKEVLIPAQLITSVTIGESLNKIWNKQTDENTYNIYAFSKLPDLFSYLWPASLSLSLSLSLSKMVDSSSLSWIILLVGSSYFYYPPTPDKITGIAVTICLSVHLVHVPGFVLRIFSELLNQW